MSDWYDDSYQWRQVRSAPFSDLNGLTLKEVRKSDDKITFLTDEGRVFVMEHIQDCCESVYIESITGDLDDLIGSEILLAEESSNRQCDDWESCTWTFYKLATIKGYVDIRWHGSSNGYYSEAVSFFEYRSKYEY